MQPWQTIEKIETKDGALELRQRGERDFLIMIHNRVLMNSSASRSERVLGKQACEAIASHPRPRVLVGGLGMGLTLRAALDALPESATIVVAELNPVVVRWCRGPLSLLTQRAVDDPRVAVRIDNVADVIAQAADPGAEKFDAIIIDLYEGPGAGSDPVRDPYYGSRALSTTVSALTPAGVFAVWGENPDAGFEKRLSAAGFSVRAERPGKGGLRHVVYMAVRS